MNSQIPREEGFLGEILRHYRAREYMGEKLMRSNKWKELIASGHEVVVIQ